jgi:tyrosinase
MKSQYLTTASLLATLGFATPVTQVDVVEKRQQPGPGSYYAITGARDGVFPRLEVRELEKNADMWNLFILALTDFQAIDQKQIDSYYQIAGSFQLKYRPHQ